LDGAARGSIDHIIILDGTLSSLNPGEEGSCGLLFKLLTEQGRSVDRTVYYEQGLQWEGWRQSINIIEGRGINRQIRRTYGWLASHYREGDRIFLFGYSRGAYAVRSLAGVIDRVGLLKREHATERGVQLAYRHYQAGGNSDASSAFARRYCHEKPTIEMVGVWDTVKSLGLRMPFFWMWTTQKHAFHNHELGPAIRHGFHALAIHETRVAFEPVMWSSPADWEGRVQQMWFRGAHGDIGGMVGADPTARPLANIPLVWMLDRAETVGMHLPAGWRAKFPCDANAPMVGTMRGWGMLFLFRRKRKMMNDISEQVHPTAEGQRPFCWTPWPLTLLF
jgi:uncharacterized protein (DUF2235 family)